MPKHSINSPSPESDPLDARTPSAVSQTEPPLRRSRSSPAPIVEIDRLVVRYPRAKEPSIRGVSLSLNDGINALVGRNGAGKSTLMNTIVSLQKPLSGSIKVLHTSLPAGEKQRRKLMRSIGYLAQNFGFIGNFSVKEFVEYAAWLKSVPSKAIRAATARAIEEVDMQDRAKMKLSKLSGGMLRRVGIATAVVHDPKLVILDEPTAGLDPEQRINFRDTLRRISHNRCVLISSHLIEDVQAIADQVFILDLGSLVFSGSVEEMKTYATDDAMGDSPLERAYTNLIAWEGEKRTGVPSGRHS